MARKGEVARDRAKAQIISAFGDRFVALVDKKIYVEVDDDGEMVQVAISLTVPKNPVSAADDTSKTESSTLAAWEVPEVMRQDRVVPQTSNEETEMINKLCEKLGITD